MIKLTKKTKFALAAAILLVCGLLFCGLYLRAHAAYTPSGALHAPTTKHPRVALTGSGYRVNDAKATPLKNTGSLFIKKVVKKKTVQQPKKKTTTVKKPQPKSKKSTSRKSKKTTATNKKTTAARKKPSSKTQEINKNAHSGKAIQIMTSIPKDCTTDKKSYEFTVTAKTASGKSVPYSDINLTSPKKFKRLKSGKSNDKYIAKFSIDLDVGTNTIIIKATDKKTNTSSTIKEYVKRTDPNKRTDSVNEYPYIKTSLKNGMKTSKSYIDFTVEGADENGKPVTNYHTPDDSDTSDYYYFYVWIYDDEFSEYSPQDYIGNSKYRIQLQHGKNIISISITKNSRDSSEEILTTEKTIYCTSKSTGTVTVGIEAPTLSLGKLAPDRKIKIYPNDTTVTIAERYLKKTGFHTTGYPIEEISKKGIATNAKVPKELIVAMKEDYAENKETSHKTDSISSEDFYSNSDWLYCINGEDYQYYVESIEDLKEEYKNLQKITIVFSLTGYGDDLDGTLEW